MYQHVSVVVQLLRPAQFVFLSCKSVNKILNTKVYKLQFNPVIAYNAAVSDATAAADNSPITATAETTAKSVWWPHATTALLWFHADTGVFSQPSIYIDGWLYAMSMTSVVCNVPVLSQNDSTYHHSVFTT